MLYREFVKTMADRVRASIDTIEVGNNLEHGVEFEFALCEALRAALPDRFGVGRGYAVNRAGDTAGDDIFIFARERFPTLALRARDDFARKEFVPIEAAYCYIEAKHSIYLDGDEGQSLSHALQQASRVKALCSSRESVSPEQVLPYVRLGAPITVTTPSDFPKIVNPMFVAVMARHVRQKAGAPPLTSGTEIERRVLERQIPTAFAPDLVVLGDDLVLIPTVSSNGVDRMYRSPFFIEGRSTLATRVAPGLAFGVGLASILTALDWIQLGVLPWHRIVADALEIIVSDSS